MNKLDKLDKLKNLYGVVRLHNFAIFLLIFIIIYMADITYKQSKKIKELEAITSKNVELMEKSTETDTFLLNLYNEMRKQMDKDKKTIEL